MSAASFIVNNHGGEKLTLEAVAKEAGVSKGGLLHHFPNKKALIKGMLEELTHDYISEVQDKASNAATDDGKWTRAYIEATFGDTMNNGIKELLNMTK
ncbi:hypothetical protein PMSD_07580 [Paenibacillus macquariensis subsp. defensor]|nr:hypothetical protein PMSD_07580 [Paenibacillus macquariensis subsp. defensor]